MRLILLMVSCTLAACALAGCARTERPTGQPPRQPGGPPETRAPRLGGAAADPDAAGPASPAAVIRGILVLSGEDPRLIPCGESAPIPLTDATGGDLLAAYGELASESTGEMWAELRGVRGAQAITAHEVLRAQPVGEGDPCGLLLPSGHLRASGNEPFWSITVTGEHLEFLEPGAEPLRFPGVATSVDGGRRTWTTEISAGGGPDGAAPRRLVLVVAPARCKDGMSGAWHPLAAEATLDGRALSGCAHESP